jgi:rhodanese-related sulfurtransferase
MKLFKPCIAGLTLVVLAVTVAAQEHTKDSTATVKKNLEDKKAILVDVREQGEWDAGHLRDAKLMPLSILKGDKADDLAKTLPKDQIIYLHCASGKRCLTAATVLQKMGFDARPLKEGFKDLLKAGFPQADK